MHTWHEDHAPLLVHANATQLDIKSANSYCMFSIRAFVVGTLLSLAVYYGLIQYRATTKARLFVEISRAAAHHSPSRVAVGES